MASRQNAPRRAGRARALGLALLSAAPSPARAYCRRSVCDGRVATSCQPARAGDCGTPARWASPCISFSVSERAPPGQSVEATRELMTAAFQAWEAADCGGGERPALRVSHRGPVACAKHEYNRRAGNANLVVFHDGPWPYGGGGGMLALTTLSYGSGDAMIYDADVEFNWAELKGMDLPPVALHEAGHFLGLAHSEDPASVMNEDVHGGGAAPRALSADDVAAICAIFPPAMATSRCDFTPRNGFRGECRSPPPPGPARGPAVAVPLGVSAAALAGGLAGLRRWRRRPKAR